MFISGSIIALYFLIYFFGEQRLGINLLITDSAVVVSVVTCIVGTISCLWLPKKIIFSSALFNYGLLVATIGTLIATTAGPSSPFVTLWMLVAAFAAIFGLFGIIPVFIAGSMYVILEAIQGSVSQSTLIITVVVAYVPLIASFIIWHGKSSGENGKDPTFANLASELNQVANNSEVVINAIADGVLAINSQGIIQLINPAAQQITGWGKQDATTLSYKSVLKLMDNKDQELPDALDPIQQALGTNKEVRTTDLSLTTNLNKKLLVSIVVSPVGQIGSGVIVVFRDITNEKAEERVQAEFISTASHEMRTPIASIEGYLGLALNPATAQIDAKARDYIDKAHEASLHLGRLFKDLLDVSRAEDGRLSNNPKVVDVVAYARDIVEGMRPQAVAKGLGLVFNPESGDDKQQSERRLTPVYYAQVDNDHLREVIANLTENAIKYTLKGTVTIDITGDSEHIVISVADSGIGIPVEDIPHLFQKFYRVDDTDTREIGGTGLGLYLCRRLAETMGGRVRVESEYKRGSTFFLEIPRIDHQTATHLIEVSEQKMTDAELAPAAIPELKIPETPPPVEEVYASSTVTSPPAELIAQQLQSITSKQPQPPVPVTQPVTSIALPEQHVNTPLATIEQNPDSYVQPQPRRVTIPVRVHDNKPKA